MDLIQIILTIAACIGGLILLYVVIAAIAIAIAVRKGKKAMDDFDARFDRNFRRR